MGRRRDLVRGLVRTTVGLLRGGGETPASSAPSVRPPRADGPAASDRLVEPGDLWAVRYAIEPQGKWLLVNHWASWCEPCIEELPRLVELFGRHRERMGVVGISWERFASGGAVDDARNEAEEACIAHGVGWRSVLYTGEPSDLIEGLELADRVIPQSYLFDAEGGRKWTHVGPIGHAEVAEIEGLVGS
jgi:thiol-disulfide isomerase/thioredoxin